MKILATSLNVPERRSRSTPRRPSEGRPYCEHFRFMELPGRDVSLAAIDDDEDICAVTLDGSPTVVAVSSGDSASDMAAAAARQLLDGAGDDLGSTHAIIYCHSTPDEASASSPACRLQHELRRPQAFPFAVGQQNSVGVFSALEIARSLLVAENPRGHVLIVAGDRWVAPLRRHVAGLTVLGDGAGALLLGSGPALGLEVVDVRVRGPGVRAPHGDAAAETRTFLDALAEDIAVLAGEALATHGWARDQLRAVVASNINPGLAQRIRIRLGATNATFIETYERFGFVSAADAIVGLDCLRRECALAGGDRVLVWAASPNSDIACALLRFSGS